jgi:hypothetical protein
VVSDTRTDNSPADDNDLCSAHTVFPERKIVVHLKPRFPDDPSGFTG